MCVCARLCKALLHFNVSLFLYCVCVFFFFFHFCHCIMLSFYSTGWLACLLACLFSCVFFSFSLSAPFEPFACNRSVGFCYNFPLARLVAWSLFSSRHITLFRKKPFRYLIFHINTHNFIYVCRTFVCLCVKLSRNAALIPHIYFSLFFHRPSGSHKPFLSLFLSNFLPHIIWHYSILTSHFLYVHFAFAQYLNLFYSSFSSHSVSHTHSFSILFWICPPTGSLSLFSLAEAFSQPVKLISACALSFVMFCSGDSGAVAQEREFYSIFYWDGDEDDAAVSVATTTMATSQLLLHDITFLCIRT